MSGRKTNFTLSSVPVPAMLVFIALMARCTMDLAGGSSEIGNGIILGKIVDEQGAPACSTIVRIMTSDYDPLKDGLLADTCIDTTSEDGMFRFIAQQGQTFSIQAVHMALRTRLIVPGVAMSNAEINVPQCTLKVPGAIKVALPDNVDPLFGYVNVPGSEIFAFLNNSAGFVTLDSVPAGTIPAVYYSSTTNAISTVIRYDVPVIPGETTAVWNPAWKYARRLVLNTTPSGANVAGSVTNFPVLVRLQADNFEFTQAKPDGADVRFAKADGTPLPYEIERWDPATRLAEVWVKVDTVHGNDSTQSLLMYWGNDLAAGNSNSAAVFDTAGGFAGVWHLGENGDNVFDATSDAFNGINSGTVAATGMIGNARSFANGNYIKIQGLLKSPAKVTLSAWVRSDTSGRGTTINQGQDIISMGDVAVLRADNIKGIGTTGFYHNSGVSDTSYASAGSGRYIANTGWHLITYSANTTTHVHSLYVDGVQSAISNDSNPIYYAGLGTDTYIGMHGNGKPYFNFTGQIDEVRVNDIPLSSDWTKLCFMNQKEQDALIVFK